MPFAAYPTPYPEINHVLELLLSSVRAVLGDQFVGMYLCGSLATGDFDYHHSDIDFAVVTASVLSDAIIQNLKVMHERLNSRRGKWESKLEGAYIPREIIRRHSISNSTYPCVNEGKFFLAPLHSDWIIQRHVLGEQGVVLAGPPPRDLIDPVSPDDLRRAVSGILHEWWQPILNRPEELLRVDYQPFAVLTMCRALYTLEHGAIASKPASAKWAMDALDQKWIPLIRWALEHGPTSESTLDDILAFIRYTLVQTDSSIIPASPVNRLR